MGPRRLVLRIPFELCTPGSADATMPPKRKAQFVPQTVCPITGLPIDGQLRKRLKAAPAVNGKWKSDVCGA